MMHYIIIIAPFLYTFFLILFNQLIVSTDFLDIYLSLCKECEIWVLSREVTVNCALLTTNIARSIFAAENCAAAQSCCAGGRYSTRGLTDTRASMPSHFTISSFSAQEF